MNKKDEIKDNESLKPGRSGTVLLVDDEEINRIIGQDLLESIGYKVLLAENGKVSVEKFIENHSEIDIVLMDMKMPVMNGSEAFIKMKQIDENSKIIIVSGYTDKDELNGLFEQGLFGFVRKPYKIQDISQMLHKAIEQK